MKALGWIGAWLGMVLSSWPVHALENDPTLDSVLEALGQSATGHALLQKAQEKWKFADTKSVAKIFKWDVVSRTDALLTRHFNPQPGEEQRERTVTVYLKSNQPFTDLLLDIAHELTHAVAEPSWDPYDAQLTVDHYVWAALEAPGGEVDAMISECLVGYELKIVSGSSIERCRRYRGDGKLNRERVKADFYRVGSWSTEVVRRLRSKLTGKFPLISNLSPVLYSSTGRAPYPIALIREFDELTDRACKNSRRRMENFVGRAPASLLPYESATIRFVQSRCEGKD
jgi:hypothetical protein